MLKTTQKTAQQLIDIIGRQKDVLSDFDEALRSYHSGDLNMDVDKFEDLVSDFNQNNKNLTDAIKGILFSLKEQ
jgi:hypothetical protein